MKKALLLLAMSTPLFLQAQSLQNTNFENWTIANYSDLQDWITSNEISIPLVGLPSATEVNPGVTNSALKLETVANTTDTMVGFITNSDDPFSGDGGFPYSQKPTGLSGYFRYNIMPNDTARILVVFKNSGIVYSVDTISIWGTQNSFTLNSFPLPWISASGITPDTVILAVASSDVVNSVFVAGSTLELDNLVFTGPGISQTIHGDFDTWVPKTISDLTDWSISGEVSRTTDAFSGTYAAKLITLNGSFGTEPAGIFQSFSVTPTQAVDTLIGWYKYLPKGMDSASIELNLFGPGPGVTITKNLGAAASYAQFKVPITGVTSSTMGIFLNIQSSAWSGTPTDSSTLYIDSISIKPGTVGVNEIVGTAGVSVYPNPAKDVLKMAVDNKVSEVEVTLYNTFGARVSANTVKVDGAEVTLPVKHLATGLYIYEVKVGDATYKGRFMKD